MSVAICPSCENEIKLTRKVELGQRIRCPHCYEDLEVIETKPVELDWPFEDEDWDDDWDDEELDEGEEQEDW